MPTQPNRRTTNVATHYKGIPVFVSVGRLSSARSFPAFLVDVNRFGALVEMAIPLPNDSVVSVRLMETVGAGSSRVRVVRADECRKVFTTPWWKKRSWLLRVAFVGPRPQEFLRAALGILRPDALRDSA